MPSVRIEGASPEQGRDTAERSMDYSTDTNRPSRRTRAATQSRRTTIPSWFERSATRSHAPLDAKRKHAGTDNGTSKACAPWALVLLANSLGGQIPYMPQQNSSAICQEGRPKSNLGVAGYISCSRRCKATCQMQVFVSPFVF